MANPVRPFRSIAVGSLLALSGTTYCAAPAQAGPPPRSQVTASRLKENPPPNWLSHYLGDDRYILASGIWKVVSTETDHYYHKPNCPNMLRQSADRVIGFSSTADAEEAGYAPDPECLPPAMSFGGFGGSMMQGSLINDGRKAIRLTLGDGASTVLLPPGWKRVMSMTRTAPQYNITYSMDMFAPISGKGTVMVSESTMGNFDLSPFLSAANIRNGLKQLPNALNGGTGVVDNRYSALFDQLRGALQNMTVRDVTLGGAKGVETTIPGHGIYAGTSIIVSKGGKIYSISQTNNSKSGSATIFHSFHPG